jgi:hypothetical protein
MSGKLAAMKMQIPQVLLAATTLTLNLHAASLPEWQNDAISPVVNPIFFESPLIQSEVRPLFAYHRFDKVSSA